MIGGKQGYFYVTGNSGRDLQGKEAKVSASKEDHSKPMRKDSV